MRASLAFLGFLSLCTCFPVLGEHASGGRKARAEAVDYPPAPPLIPVSAQAPIAPEIAPILRAYIDSRLVRWPQSRVMAWNDPAYAQADTARTRFVRIDSAELGDLLAEEMNRVPPVKSGMVLTLLAEDVLHTAIREVARYTARSLGRVPAPAIAHSIVSSLRDQRQLESAFRDAFPDNKSPAAKAAADRLWTIAHDMLAYQPSIESRLLANLNDLYLGTQVDPAFETEILASLKTILAPYAGRR